MTSDIAGMMESIASCYEFEEIGDGEHLVHTGMYLDDGDELHIVMREVSGGYVLTDEGHTMMWLSSDGHGLDDDRKGLLDRIVGQYGVVLDGGRLSVFADSASEAGPALSSLIQAILRVSHLYI